MNTYTFNQGGIDIDLDAAMTEFYDDPNNKPMARQVLFNYWSDGAVSDKSFFSFIFILFVCNALCQ